MSTHETLYGPFYRLVSPGVTPRGRLFVEIDYREGRLSITGVEGPMSNGNCRGSCGQTGIPADLEPNAAEGWDAGKVEKLRQTWDRWHLNDMRVACEHQRELWAAKPLEVVEYGLTMEAQEMRRSARRIASRAAVAGEVATLSAADRALLSLELPYLPVYQAPDADSPLSGCYEARKRETKAAGWVYPKEHPEGLLTKRCPVCGYKYGSSWLKEEVPASVLGFLCRLKDTTCAFRPATYDPRPAWKQKKTRKRRAA